jgi:hypothetical protein
VPVLANGLTIRSSISPIIRALGEIMAKVLQVKPSRASKRVFAVYGVPFWGTSIKQMSQKEYGTGEYFTLPINGYQNMQVSRQCCGVRAHHLDLQTMVCHVGGVNKSAAEDSIRAKGAKFG